MPGPHDRTKVVALGGTMYVKSKNTRVWVSPSPTADVVAILQPQAAVTWLGRLPGDPRWHRVRHGAKEGVMFGTNLSPTMPTMTVLVNACSPCDATGWVPAESGPRSVWVFERCQRCGGTAIDPGRVRAPSVDPKGFIPSGPIKA